MQIDASTFLPSRTSSSGFRSGFPAVLRLCVSFVSSTPEETPGFSPIGRRSWALKSRSARCNCGAGRDGCVRRRPGASTLPGEQEVRTHYGKVYQNPL